jgi:hypothetical protein
LVSISEQLFGDTTRAAAEWQAAAAPLLAPAKIRLAQGAAKMMAAQREKDAIAAAPCESPSTSRIRAHVSKNWSPSILGHIACRSAVVGMTSDQATAAWGRPNDINRTTYTFGVHEQWVYDGGGYLYFEDGVLDAIQN